MPAPSSPNSNLRSRWFLSFSLVVATLVLVNIISMVSLRIVLIDGGLALYILASATGIGLWLVRAVGLGRAEIRWQILLAAGLGIGCLSLLTLGLGVCGLLNRGLFIAVLTAGLVAGTLRCFSISKSADREFAFESEPKLNILWPALSFFAAIALAAATIPPGILWPAEGNGYDVLEYHLGVPREYFEAGRISYLPHNIYSNFPFGVEMLYLVAMIVRGSAVHAAFAAQVIHCFLAMLGVAAIWLAAREFDRSGAIVAVVLAASCPFLIYLSGLAYVENGLVFYAALSLAAMLRAARGIRWIIASGLCCGLACGCKYTAVPSVLIPLTLVATWMGMRAKSCSFAPTVAFIAACLLTFSPWLVKNIAYTGNPVFPLARSIMPEKPGIWDNDGAARWHEGHLPAPADRSLSRRIAFLWDEVLGSTLFGLLVLLALVIGGIGVFRLIGQRQSSGSTLDPRLISCWLMLLVGIVAWTGFTHLVGRFAIVLIVPAAVILGCAWRHISLPPLRWALPLGLVYLNGYFSFQLLNNPKFDFSAISRLRQDDSLDWFRNSRWPGQEHIGPLNALATVNHQRVLMVGEARRFYLDRGVDYCVVFNRNPFAEAAAVKSPAELLQWLSQKGYQFVYVDWSEMRRLRNSRYGFWKSIDEQLFKRLVDAGLRPVEEFRAGNRKNAYSTLFALPGVAPASQPTAGRAATGS